MLTLEDCNDPLGFANCDAAVEAGCSALHFSSTARFVAVGDTEDSTVTEGGVAVTDEAVYFVTSTLDVIGREEATSVLYLRQILCTSTQNASSSALILESSDGAYLFDIKECSQAFCDAFSKVLPIEVDVHSVEEMQEVLQDYNVSSTSFAEVTGVGGYVEDKVEDGVARLERERAERFEREKLEEEAHEAEREREREAMKAKIDADKQHAAASQERAMKRLSIKRHLALSTQSAIIKHTAANGGDSAGPPPWWVGTAPWKPSTDALLLDVEQLELLAERIQEMEKVGGMPEEEEEEEEGASDTEGPLLVDSESGSEGGEDVDEDVPQGDQADTSEVPQDVTEEETPLVRDEPDDISIHDTEQRQPEEEAEVSLMGVQDLTTPSSMQESVQGQEVVSAPFCVDVVVPEVEVEVEVEVAAGVELHSISRGAAQNTLAADPPSPTTDATSQTASRTPSPLAEVHLEDQRQLAVQAARDLERQKKLAMLPTSPVCKKTLRTLAITECDEVIARSELAAEWRSSMPINTARVAQRKPDRDGAPRVVRDSLVSRLVEKRHRAGEVGDEVEAKRLDLVLQAVRSSAMPAAEQTGTPSSLVLEESLAMLLRTPTERPQSVQECATRWLERLSPSPQGSRGDTTPNVTTSPSLLAYEADPSPNDSAQRRLRLYHARKQKRAVQEG